MKEILLDLVEVTRAEISNIDDQLVDFGVVGPGPRRILNWINGRRWFDNDQDTSPAAERMYLEELNNFRAYMIGHGRRGAAEPQHARPYLYSDNRAY